ncbi:hypothetical protein CJ030_MR8G028293 [Morella rubra]|uniref:RNase H type-1 domain-containing protein n=1 Tax=Morella rubra TaxID=262757 RepID=A0A6A1UV27_9ROSI|nr:hypothetical protein CJ030_MR8G028293 [Morella rubra]
MWATIRRIQRLYAKHSKAWTSVRPPKPIRWVRPRGNMGKINFDAAVQNDFSLLAAVCRNYDGQILFAWTKRAPPGTPSGTHLVGEAKAALFAVQEASFLNNRLVEFEGDNLQVCNALSLENFQPDWSISSYILDARALLCKQLSWKVHHVGRLANGVAHSLAKWAARENLVGKILVHCIPTDVLDGNGFFQPNKRENRLRARQKRMEAHSNTDKILSVADHY